MSASVVLVIGQEPPDRLRRALAALERQVGTEPIEVVIAASPLLLEECRALDSRGAVARIEIVSNPTGRRTPGLNAAARAASGDVLVRVDARSRVPPDYVARCLNRLEVDADVGVVGGHQQPVEHASSVRARGIARALRNPWIVGGAAYRRLDRSGPVDTVYLGAFRRPEFLAFGGYDERLDANEDFELCARYQHAGYTVWLESGLVVRYEARASFRELWRQYEDFGRSKLRYWTLTGERPNPRQAVALALALAGAATVALSKRRALALAIAAAGLAALDHAAEPTETDPSVRASSVVASAVAQAAWTTGVLREAAVSLR